MPPLAVFQPYRGVLCIEDICMHNVNILYCPTYWCCLKYVQVKKHDINNILSNVKEEWTT